MKTKSTRKNSTRKYIGGVTLSYNDTRRIDQEIDFIGTTMMEYIKDLTELMLCTNKLNKSLGRCKQMSIRYGNIISSIKMGSQNSSSSKNTTGSQNSSSYKNATSSQNTTNSTNSIGSISSTNSIGSTNSICSTHSTNISSIKMTVVEKNFIKYSNAIRNQLLTLSNLNYAFIIIYNKLCKEKIRMLDTADKMKCTLPLNTRIRRIIKDEVEKIKKDYEFIQNIELPSTEELGIQKNSSDKIEKIKKIKKIQSEINGILYDTNKKLNNMKKMGH